MAKYTGPILKKCRRLGIEPIVLGIHKKSNSKQVKVRRRKPSGYSLQLCEKQKVKFIYGILEKQFHKYYEMAEKQRGNTGENMLILIERRLDNVIFRLGFGATRAQSRQLVNHGHVLVNGKRVNIPSYLVSKGDVISIAEKSLENAYFKDIKEFGLKSVAPKWLQIDKNTLVGTVAELPVGEDLDPTIRVHMIVELYSK